MRLPGTLDPRRLGGALARSFAGPDPDPDRDGAYEELAGGRVADERRAVDVDLSTTDGEWEAGDWDDVDTDGDAGGPGRVRLLVRSRRGRRTSIGGHDERFASPEDDAHDGAYDDGDEHGEAYEDRGGFADDGVAVDPRIAARRDGVAQARRDRRRRRLIAIAVVVALLLAAGATTRSAALDVDQVAISGATNADPADLRAASGITPGQPLIGLDLDRARAGVLAEPWVLDATVERSWSGTVSISVVERTPVATVNAGDGGWLLIDRDRRIVAASTTPPPLPIVDGIGTGSVGDDLPPGAGSALAVASALGPEVRSRVAVVHGADPDAIELALQPTGTVRFGPANAIDERMRSLETVFAQVDLLCLATIDLRVPDAPVLTRIPSCA